jgi:hypothetical protein
MKRVHPSPSFEILLPNEIARQSDERVSSFWLKGEPLLLQLSSYKKREGDPISAGQRLQERIDRSGGQWKVWNGSRIEVPGSDQAIGETLDDGGFLWVHAYFVWPHLTIYATISGPEDVVRNPQSWAMTALANLKLNLQ